MQYIHVIRINHNASEKHTVINRLLSQQSSPALVLTNIYQHKIMCIKDKFHNLMTKNIS